jgi:hypothetical protein
LDCLDHGKYQSPTTDNHGGLISMKNARNNKGLIGTARHYLKVKKGKNNLCVFST